MSQTKPSFFQRYLLPGFAFQSVVIAGGYGTGRELAEFFLSEGPIGGLLAMMVVSTLIWSAVSAASFEFARVHNAYDYRSFFQHLLGRGWFLFEICYAALLLIILAVIAATAGSILQESFGLPYGAGVLGMMAIVGLLTFWGTGIIEKFLAGWSFVLYAVYIALVVWCFSRFGADIRAGFSLEPVGTGWVVGGIKYAAYNLALVPAILFSVRHTKTRKEAVTAGLLTGPIAMLPALFFYLPMVGQYPHILDETVPATFLLNLLGSPAFMIVFQIVLFGTLIETGIGLLHAVNERLAVRFQEIGLTLPRRARPAVAVACLAIGAVVAQFGLIALIARGYGTLTWFFLAVFVVPVLTLGINKILKSQRELA